jgi:hypothetical protein
VCATPLRVFGAGGDDETRSSTSSTYIGEQLTAGPIPNDIITVEPHTTQASPTAPSYMFVVVSIFTKMKEMLGFLPDKIFVA